MTGWPIPADEELRLSVLPSYGLLGSSPEPMYDAITSTVAEFFDAPICLVTVVGENIQWLKSRHGLDVESTSRDASFCAHTIISDEPLVVPDARADARFRDNPLVLGEPRIRFYAGAPIVTAAGCHLGALCVIDPAPRMTIDTTMLTKAAAVVASMFDERLRQRRAAEETDILSITAAARNVATLMKQLGSHFNPDLFGDPALNILLEVFIASEDSRHINLSDCFSARGVARSTGLRWVKRLTEEGLIARNDDPDDRRNARLRLTDDGSERMRRWLGSTLH